MHSTHDEYLMRRIYMFDQLTLAEKQVTPRKKWLELSTTKKKKRKEKQRERGRHQEI